MIYSVELPNGYTISDDRNRIDMELVHRCLADAYWAAGRPRAVTERSWANCLCVGIYAPDGVQVGFARLLTDYALRGHLGDVFMLDHVRGLGLGKALVATILGHPELETVTHWSLATRDAQSLYAKFGFVSSPDNHRWMTLTRPSPEGSGGFGASDQ